MTIYITLVEFTGLNWKVLHGRNLTDDPQKNGNITLYDGYDGTSNTGIPYSVFDWDNAISQGTYSPLFAEIGHMYNDAHVAAGDTNLSRTGTIF